MKLLESKRAWNLRAPFAPAVGVLSLCFVSLLVSAARASEAHMLTIDLLRMSEMMDVRYYIAEKGELPPKFLLLGGLSFYRNPLESEFDLRDEVVEYDEGTGLIYRFRVPRQFRFSRKEERRDLFYYYAPRDLTVPGLGIAIERTDERLAAVRMRSTRATWIADVRYNLMKERAERAGKGLLSLDIPIALPKPIERIIGKGEETNLTVQGSERISVSGTSDWCSNCPNTEGRPRQDKFPDLDMEQQLNVSLHGSIGEKINVEIQHSSSGEGAQSTNKVRLNYRGFDDDIIKRIEMGDTDLSLSGAQLVSYSGAAKGLFGVKAIAQTGPLDLTVIASKEEGESASGSYSSQGGQLSKAEIADYDYIDRQFFHFENPGRHFLRHKAGFRSIHPVIGGTAADDIEVYVSVTEREFKDPTFKEDWMFGTAYPDSSNNGLADDIGPGGFEGKFKRIYQVTAEGRGDYELIQDYGNAKGTRFSGIRLVNSLDDERSLAVCYRALNDSTGAVTDIGDYQRDLAGNPATVTNRLIMELICRPQDDPLRKPKTDPTWNMTMRNVYSIGAGLDDPSATLDIRIEDTSLRAIKYLEPVSNINYLRLFGLDRYDRAGNKQKDDMIDEIDGVLDLSRGYLMFPWYEPFNPTPEVVAAFLDGTSDAERNFAYATLVRDSVLYNSVVQENIRKDHHYSIVVESSSGQRTFQLSAYDIIEGSEVVSVDGSKLQRGSDYDIDYLSGTVTLKGDATSRIGPDSKVNIDYQHKPLLGGGKNSLLGLGANLNLSPNSRISGTFLYSSMGAPKYSPRLGEEPARTMATDINGSFVFYPRWMTSLANLLPRVDTNNQSTLNISAEVAVSMPNPNVKGEALIDDMEGVEDNDVVSLLRRMWYKASPVDNLARGPDQESEFYWYNTIAPNKDNATPLDPYMTSRRDLNPRLQQRENSTVTSLVLDAVNPAPGQWCGVMAGFPGGGFDIATAQYLEIWVNDFQTVPAVRGGTLHIDFGNIDEDFFEPALNVLNDEAKPPYYTWTINDDIGFGPPPDGENCKYTRDFEGFNQWDSAKKTYDGINCRNGNAAQDTEDLNDNGRLDSTDTYYTLSLDLADDAVIDVQRDFDREKYGDYWDQNVDGKYYNRDKSWRMYRIDLSKAVTVPPLAEPRLDAIQHMRIWIESPDALKDQGGTQHPRLLQLAELQFVGNRWELDGVRDFAGKLLDPAVVADDQKLTVGTINNKDDPVHYQVPYRIQQEEGIENKEQSLRFKFQNFDTATSFRVVKRFFGQGQNYEQYRDFRFFVYPTRVDSLAPGDVLGFYLQIAYDSMNYYEIEVPITPQDTSRWTWVNVNFADLTNLKVDAGDDIVERPIRDAINPARIYTARLRGTPTLFQVRYLFAGFRNRTSHTIDSGEAWFNDIKLGGVRRDVDHAERMSFTADFAGVLQVNGSWQRTGPEFRSLKQSRGSGVTNSSVSLNAKTQIESFIPTARFSLPVNFQYSSSNMLPKYIPQSDVEIADRAVRDELRSVNSSYGFNVSMSRRGSTNFIMKNLFDNLRTGFSYSQRNLFAPTSRDTSWAMSGNLNYDLKFSRSRQLSLFRGIKWRYWLSNLTYQSSASRRIEHSYTKSGDAYVTRPFRKDGGWDNAGTALYEPFESVKIDFNVNERRDLAVIHNFYKVPIGIQTNFGHTMKLNYQPGPSIFILSELSPRFEFKSRYSEDLRPSIRQQSIIEKERTEILYDTLGVPIDTVKYTERVVAFDPFGTRNAGAQRDMNITFNLDVAKYVTRLGQAAHLIKKGEVSERKGRVVSGSQPGKTNREEFMRRREEAKIPPSRENAGKIVAPAEDEPPVPPGPGGEATQQPPPDRSGEGARASALQDLAALRRPAREHSADTSRAQDAAAKADTTAKGGAAAPADTLAARKYDPFTPVKKLIKLIGLIEPVMANINMAHQSSYQRIYDRAGVFYQLGLTDEAGVPGKTSDDEKSPENSSDNLTVDLRSKIGLTSNIGMDVNCNLNVRNDDSRGRKSETKRLVWPALTVNWGGMEKYGLLKRYVKQSDLRVGIERRKNMEQRGDESSYSITPNWTLEWKNALSSTVGMTYKKGSTVKNDREVWDKSWGINVGLRYNFEGSKGVGIPLPFLNKKKFSFKSTLTTSLNVSYNNQSSYNQPASSALAVSPNVSYRFSNNATGSLGVNYRRSSGGRLGYINQAVEVRLSAEFKF